MVEQAKKRPASTTVMAVLNFVHENQVYQLTTKDSGYTKVRAVLVD